MVGGYDGYTVFTFEEKDGERRRVKIDAKQEKDYTTKADFEQLAFIREQVAYQRKGLNDYGWSLLPENCEYDDNLKNVKEMVMRGGLSEEFLDEWVEDETVLWAWW
jgi:hypothetical protein